MDFIKPTQIKDFTMVSNEVLRTKDLSLRAKALHAYMLSYAYEHSNFEVYIEGLGTLLNSTPHIIRETLKELQEKGYILRLDKYDDREKIAYIKEKYARLGLYLTLKPTPKTRDIWVIFQNKNLNIFFNPNIENDLGNI